MKGIFLFPPCFDPSMPYLAPYLLSSYVNEYFKSQISDVIDLNILFYNRVCHNQYHNIDPNFSVSEAVDFFYKIETEMVREMDDFSHINNVTLTRQSLLFDFDRFKSEDVFQFLQTDSAFSNFIVTVFNENVNLDKYSFVGLNISCQDQLVPAFIIAKYIRSVSNTNIIIGGNIVSRCYDGLTKSKLKQYFDFLVIKEGEFALCNIIRSLSNLPLLDNLRANAIYSCKDNSIIDNIDIPNIVNINSIPTAKFEDELENKYFAPQLVLPVFFSRGCSWGKCRFCGIHSSWCAKYRSKSPEHFCDEIEYYIESYGCKNFRFIDESPSIYDILAISNELIKRELDINIEAYLNISKHLLDEDLVQVLAKAGIKQLFFGIESVNSDILSSMNKDINDPSFFADILDNTFNCGIHNYAFFLMGYPGDDESNEEDLKKFIIDTNSLGTIAISSFIPVAGTPIVDDKSLTDGMGILYEKKGDLSNKCNYTVNGVDNSLKIKLRTRDIVETIMSARTDLKVTSKMPYETRFYMCLHYGNDFGKKYVPSDNGVVGGGLSKEQEARVLRPE